MDDKLLVEASMHMHPGNHAWPCTPGHVHLALLTAGWLAKVLGTTDDR
ncbi:MAG: hypothetical protein O3B72_09960 [Proteobacteria bacterium]|nr:hypothetical protein [Pseudomonadota bacterium]